MEGITGCPPGADNWLGPRIDTSCRSFDFTLLFEDSFFIALPAAIFLLVQPVQLHRLFKALTKVNSYALATWKLTLLAILFGLHLAYLVLILQTPLLRTKLGLASAVLATVAVFTAGVLSFLEDQRSTRPSDILVLYFSACSLLSLPRLRSLWLMHSLTDAPKGIWTTIFVLTIAITAIESSQKRKFLSQPYKDLSSESIVGFWSRGLFLWVLPFLKLGYVKNLSLSDIPIIGPELEGESTWTKLEASWNKTRGRHRLLRAAFRANIWSFFSGVIPRLTLSCFTFAQPFLIAAAVSNLQAQETHDRSRFGYALVGAFVLVYTGIAVSRALYKRQTFRMIARMRAGLICKIYRDTTALRHIEIKNSAGMTLMGTDVERIDDALSQVHEVWAAIPEIGIAVWLLVRQISYAAMVPLVICLVSIGAASKIASHFGPAQIAWIQRVQTRIAVTANMLNDIKAVKMLGLSDVLYTITSNLRNDELRASEKFRKLLVMQILTGNAPAVLAPFATFVTYAVIAKVKADRTLLAAQAFASLSLISLVTQPLILLCEALPRLRQGMACFERIEEYCVKVQETAEFSNPSQDSPEQGLEMEVVHSDISSTGPIVSFKGASISWDLTDDENVLRNVDLDIRPGLTAVTGPVAAGKSTLLASAVGETVVKQGSVTTPLSKIAFCSQTPWVADDTVQNNIVGDQPFDKDWFEFAISSCCLQSDLKKILLRKDFLCGSKGAALSGGQRQRLALARAVYSRLPVVILDDVMSGLDSKSISHILKNLFSETGYFRKAGISVILATHSSRVLPYMDSVVVLDNGTVADVGSYEQLKQRSTTLMEKVSSVSEHSGTDGEDESADSDEASTAAAAGDDQSMTNEEEVDVDDKRSRSWAVYSYYCRSASVLSLIFWGTFTFMGAIATSATTILVQNWTKANEEHPNEQLGLYLGIYATLVVVALGSVSGECWTFFIKVVSDTALKLHDDLLRATLGATFHFFQSTSVGSITNRFSQDMDLIDMTLPAHAVMFTTGAASCIVQLVIICVVGKYVAATVPVLFLVLFMIQRYYLRTSRQLRLIEIEAKAPIYKLFLETTEGITTLRAFGWIDAFHERLTSVLNSAQRPFYMLACIQQWLSLVLDFVTGGIAVVLVLSARASTSSISAGALGVALVLVLEFSNLLTQCVQSWTKLETSIGAVSRVQRFIQTTPSEAPGSVSLPPEFPRQGLIRLDSLTAGYGSSPTMALNQISLSIASGEKVVLCGPSGSGKSSLIMALLRMIEVREGSISIDDTDISTVSGRDLRMHLNIVPQDPFFMPGTLKSNIDPRGQSSDQSMVEALDRVGLWGKFKSQGLDAELDTTALSHGERQLLCLARAILVPSKILITDEATSSVDEDTEAKMQSIIDSEFKSRTVISVLHRFNHVHSYDRVIVLQDGKIVESGTPEGLLGTDSAFRALYDAHRS